MDDHYTEIKELIEDWQKQWDDLQSVIENHIAIGNYGTAYRCQIKAGRLKKCIQYLFKLIDYQ